MSAPQPPGTGLPAAPKPAGRRPVDQRLIVGIVIALAMVAAGIVISRVHDRGTLRKTRRLDPGCDAVVPQYPDEFLHYPECTEAGEDSVHRWQEPEEAARLHSVTPEPKIGPPTVIRADRDQLGRIRLTATCRQGDTRSEREMDRYDPGTRFGSPSLDLTDPDRKIMWTT